MAETKASLLELVDKAIPTPDGKDVDFEALKQLLKLSVNSQPCPFCERNKTMDQTGQKTDSPASSKVVSPKKQSRKKGVCRFCEGAITTASADERKGGENAPADLATPKTQRRKKSKRNSSVNASHSQPTAPGPLAKKKKKSSKNPSSDDAEARKSWPSSNPRYSLVKSRYSDLKSISGQGKVKVSNKK